MHFALPFCSASANVVALEDVLTAYDAMFQAAVHKTLAENGFEFSAGLPDLQLAREIKEALGEPLEDQGYGTNWESLQLFLDWAERQGILVDLSPKSSLLPATA